MISFRKIFNFGPLRTTISKKGMGFSIGIPGLRFGVSPDGKKYFSMGSPGTGLYMIKYFGSQKSNTINTLISTNIKEPWWK